jgi:serine/threonine protein kinase/serine/threonine protein phosphatase PrpC
MSAGSFLNASVGAYRLIDYLGAGGMGEVYRAVHASLGRVVAIKVLSATGQTASLLERFRNEARIQSTLHHPNVVSLYDFLELGGRPCIVMEYVDGQTLDDRIHREGALAIDEALRLFQEIASAVAYLHGRGIVHRDLKSNNIKLTEAGHAKLLDFGLARSAATPKLTATGHVVGTLEYMAPEQLAQQPADQRSDIWALGVVLYEMVTGRLPFEAQNVSDLMRRIIMAEYFPATAVNQALPKGVDAVIASCLKRNPDDRVGSVDALLATVRALADKLRRRTLPAGPVRLISPARWNTLAATVSGFAASRRFRIGGAAFLGVGLIATIAVALSRPEPPPPPPPPPGPSAEDPRVPRPPVDEAALTRCGLATGQTPPDSIWEITIDVLGGWGELRWGDQTLGRTPRIIKVTPGTAVSLRLTREGFLDEPVEFTPTWNTTSMQFSMPQRPDTTRAGLLGLLAWPLGLFGRRKKDDGSTASKATNAEMAAATGSGAVVISVVSDIGCVRDSNEDAIGYARPVDLGERERAGVLLVVADGMGGHSAGEVASRLAVETVIGNYATDNGDPQAALVRAVRLANKAIHEAAKSDPNRAGMGTTCTAVLIKQGWAFCAHVGDSRLYLVRDGAALQMTEDHSAVFDLVKRGVIDREVARAHPDRNVIVRALGSRPEVEVATWPQPLFVKHHDRFLVSSDGLHDLVTDEELTEVVLGTSPENGCRELVALARSRGGHDNISVGILAVGDDSPTIPMRAAHPRSDGAG